MFSLLYDSLSLISEDMFVELIKTATSSVELCFNDLMNQQTDGIDMTSPLGMALAHTYVGYYEEKLFSEI